MINLIIIFIILYIISMFVHEFGHMLGAAVQGVKSRIEYSPFRKYIPSFKTYPLTTIHDDKLFDIMGGIFTFLMFGVLAISVDAPMKSDIRFSIITLATLHFCYGIYEMFLLRKLSYKKYMIWHYILYATVISLNFTWWYILS
jgi:hypothetical protein